MSSRAPITISPLLPSSNSNLVPLTAERLAFYSQYREANGYFVKGTGRWIAELIFKNLRGPSVLDLGCGPLLPLWGIFVPKLEELVGVDIMVDALEFIRAHGDDQVFDTTIEECTNLLCEFEPSLRGSENRIVRRVYSSIQRLFYGSVLERSPELTGQFDSVMQVGCFGCLASEDELLLAMENAYSYLKKDGLFLSVIWLDNEQKERPDRPATYYGALSTRLDSQCYRSLLLRAGFEEVEASERPLPAGESTYDAILCVVARKPTS